MNLPNGDTATIDLRKILEYCLSTKHEDGQHKAHLFELLVGINADNASLLIDALCNAAAQGDARLGKRDKHGQRYVIDFDLEGPAGTALIRSAWIIRPGEAVPRFVTCYIL
jgi:hypothetical protein